MRAEESATFAPDPDFSRRIMAILVNESLGF